MRTTLIALALAAVQLLPTSVAASTLTPLQPPPASGPAKPDTALPSVAIVTQDNTALRLGPRDSSATQAVLWQGDVLEVRAQRADYLQVYDHRRERVGYVRLAQVRSIRLTADEAPQLLAVLRFVRDLRGFEALGLAYSAAYLKAAPAGANRAEAYDAMGQMAQRLARRASGLSGGGSIVSTPSSRETQLSGQLEGLAAYGVKFLSIERNGQMQLCYDGEAFRRVLAQAATPEQRAHAVLGLTRHDCQDARNTPTVAHQQDQWRAQLLDQLYSAPDFAALADWLKNRVQLRRAAVWATLAHQYSRHNDAAPQAATKAAQQAVAALAAVNPAELTDEDQAELQQTAIRVGASLWAALPQPPVELKAAGLQVVTRAGAPGQTCVLLLDAKHDAQAPLHTRCTYGTVWSASARTSPGGGAVSLAVQPLAGWRELWLYRQGPTGWVLDIVPPGTGTTELGYVEFAGWVPGGQQVLLAREALSDERLTRRFEVVRLDSLVVEKQASSPTLLAAFRKFQDPQWRSMTVSLR